MDRNVRDLVGSVVAKFVQWDGHDTKHHEDTNTVGKRRVHLIIPTKTAAGKDTRGAVGKFRGEAGEAVGDDHL